MKLIYLEWQDAHSHLGWHNESEAKDFCDNHEFIIKECGWLVKETSRYIVLAQALKDETSYWEKQLLDLHKIPKTWIRYRKNLSTR